MTIPRRFRLVVGALTLGALANAAITLLQPVGLQPFRPHDDDSLIHLVETEQESLFLEHAFYLDLAEVGSGRTLIVPEDLVDPVFVDGLSDMSLEVAPPTTIPGLGDQVDGLTGSVRPSADSPDVYDYVIADPGDDRRLHVVIDSGTLLVVGESELREAEAP